MHNICHLPIRQEWNQYSFQGALRSKICLEEINISVQDDKILLWLTIFSECDALY